MNNRGLIHFLVILLVFFFAVIGVKHFANMEIKEKDISKVTTPLKKQCDKMFDEINTALSKQEHTEKLASKIKLFQRICKPDDKKITNILQKFQSLTKKSVDFVEKKIK